MREFAASVVKEFLHIFRDRRTILIAMVMPVVQIILFGFAITTEVQNVRLAVLDPSDDVLTRRIIEQLDASEYFTLSARFQTPQEMDEAFRRSQVDMAVVFTPDFSDRLYTGESAVQLVCDATDPNTATMQTSYATGIIAAATRQLLPAGVSVPAIQPEVKLLYNPQMKSVYNFVPGVMGLILMLICAMMTSVSIVREKETGTMDLLLVSPVRPWTIVFGKLVPYFLLSCVILALTLVLSYTVLGIPFSFRLFDVIWVTILYVTLALALGLLISTIASTQVAALLISGVMFMIPVILLSGMIFPVENMPLVLQWISCVIPARWYISAMRVLMIQRLPVGYVLTEVLVLAGMTLLVLALAIKKFNAKK